MTVDLLRVRVKWVQARGQGYAALNLLLSQSAAQLLPKNSLMYCRCRHSKDLDCYTLHLSHTRALWRVWQYTAPLPSHSPAYRSQSDWRMQEKCKNNTQANHSTPYCPPCEEIAAVHKWLTSKIHGNTCTPFSSWYSMRFNMYSVLLISVSCIHQSDCPLI